MQTRKDRPANTNFGYTFKPQIWSYRPKTSELSYDYTLEYPKKIEKARRSGIIFVKKEPSFKDVKFLVVRGKWSGIWSFPKGRMNDDESEEVCAIREVQEETGINITLKELDNKDNLKIGRNTYFIINVNNIDEYNTFDIKDKYEVDLVEWKTFDELKNMSCNKDIRSILNYPEKKYTYHSLVF